MVSCWRWWGEQTEDFFFHFSLPPDFFQEFTVNLVSTYRYRYHKSVIGNLVLSYLLYLRAPTGWETEYEQVIQWPTLYEVKKWFEPRSNRYLVENDHLGDWSPEKNCSVNCRNFSRQQQSFSGLQSPRWSFSKGFYKVIQNGCIRAEHIRKTLISTMVCELLGCTLNVIGKKC